jgi:hypothetical protein
MTFFGQKKLRSLQGFLQLLRIHSFNELDPQADDQDLEYFDCEQHACSSNDSNGFEHVLSSTRSLNDLGLVNPPS